MFRRKKNWEDQFDESYGDRPERKAVEGPLLWVHIVFLIVIGVLALLGVWSVAGRGMAEKSLKEILTPVGLLWLFLALQIYFGAIYRRQALFVCSALAFLILTAGGNYFVSRLLTSNLESEFVDIDPFKTDSYDALVVLGGGSDDRQNGNAQLLQSGERIALAAELFHAGQAPLIIVTGTAMFMATENDMHPCEESQQILIRLGVPQDQIVMLKGDNTSQEMDSLKTWLEQKAESKRPQRIGLVTSAWHLRRALGLSKKRGMDLQPVPADFKTGPYHAHPSMVIPSASNLENVAVSIHEILGRLIGR
ncbi:MAG: YdcF family protein [Pirellulaceae bacterium]